MAKMQSVNTDKVETLAAKAKQSDFNDIEWLLFKGIDSEDFGEMALKARANNNFENDILTEIDINILESHGLKIV